MGIWTCLVAVGNVEGYVKSKDIEFDLEASTAREMHKEKAEGIQRNTSTTLSMYQIKIFQRIKTKIIKREKERFEIHSLTLKQDEADTCSVQNNKGVLLEKCPACRKTS